MLQGAELELTPLYSISTKQYVKGGKFLFCTLYIWIYDNDNNYYNYRLEKSLIIRDPLWGQISFYF